VVSRQSGLVLVGRATTISRKLTRRAGSSPLRRAAAVADLGACGRRGCAVAHGSLFRDFAAACIALASGDEEGLRPSGSRTTSDSRIAFCRRHRSRGFKRHRAAPPRRHRPWAEVTSNQTAGLVVDHAADGASDRGCGIGLGQAKPAPRSGWARNRERIKASPSRRNAPAATGISALAISPNTAAGRTALASDRVERHGARRLRW